VHEKLTNLFQTFTKQQQIKTKRVIVSNAHCMKTVSLGIWLFYCSLSARQVQHSSFQ